MLSGVRIQDTAVRSQTSADFNLNVTGSTNTNVWNKCSFEPLWKITRKSAHGDKPLWGHSELQRWLQPSPSQWTREVSLIAPIWCFICRNQSLVFRVHDQRKNCLFSFLTRENCFGLVLASFWFYILLNSRSNTDVEFVFRLPSVKFYEFPKISPLKYLTSSWFTQLLISCSWTAFALHSEDHYHVQALKMWILVSTKQFHMLTFIVYWSC